MRLGQSWNTPLFADVVVWVLSLICPLRYPLREVWQSVSCLDWTYMGHRGGRSWYSAFRVSLSPLSALLVHAWGER